MQSSISPEKNIPSCKVSCIFLISSCFLDIQVQTNVSTTTACFPGWVSVKHSWGENPAAFNLMLVTTACKVTGQVCSIWALSVIPNTFSFLISFSLDLQIETSPTSSGHAKLFQSNSKFQSSIKLPLYYSTNLFLCHYAETQRRACLVQVTQ